MHSTNNCDEKKLQIKPKASHCFIHTVYHHPEIYNSVSTHGFYSDWTLGSHVSVLLKSRHINGVRSSTGYAHDSSFSAWAHKSRYNLVKTNTRSCSPPNWCCFSKETLIKETGWGSSRSQSLIKEARWSMNEFIVGAAFIMLICCWESPGLSSDEDIPVQ